MLLGLAARALGRWEPGWWPVCEAVSRHVLEPLGQVFLRLLLLLVVPLVGVSVVSGALELGRGQHWGRLTTTTFGLFGMNMAVAVGLGLLVMNLWAPGRGLPGEAVRQLYEGGTIQSDRSWEPRRPELTPGMLLEMLLPRNWLGAVVDFQILPLITFALLFGFAARSLPGGTAERVRTMTNDLGRVLFRMVEVTMRLAPVAVAALMSAAVLRVGPDLLAMLAGFVAAVVIAMLLHLGVLALWVRLLGGRSLTGFYRAVRLALITAFSTSSSAATLPTSLAVARDRLGVHPGTAGFVLPLGATLNMSGTALYEGCVVLLVAQVHGVTLSWMDQVTLLVLAVLGAVAVASVPGASLPVIMGLLVQFRLPPEGVMLVLGVDRILDMARTTLNVAADLVTVCIADRVVGTGRVAGETQTAGQG